MPEPATASFQCLNRLCGKVYRWSAQPFHHQCSTDGVVKCPEGPGGCGEDGQLLGHLMAHSCPRCGSIYTKVFNSKEVAHV